MLRRTLADRDLFRGAHLVRTRLRPSASAIREVVDVRTSRLPRTAYIGPGRSSNAGDKLLHDAHRLLLAPLRLPPVQTPLAARVLNAGRGSGQTPPRFGVLLGGGTLIGEPRWRRQLETVDPRRDRVLSTLGVGVLDPRSSQFEWVRHELQSWLPILRRLEPVPVRGPLSAEVLADLGVDVQVVGDPVLALPSPPERGPILGRLGLNIGASLESRTFGRTTELVAAFGDLANTWCRRGGEVVLFSVWPPDDEICRAVAVAAGRSIRLVRWEEGATLFLEQLQSCEAVVAQKLHAVVLSVVAGRPVVPVEYQAKCRDFAASVGLDETTPRMDRCTGAELLDLVERARVHAIDQVARVQEHRARLVGELRRTAAGIVAAQRGLKSS